MINLNEDRLYIFRTAYQNVTNIHPVALVVAIPVALAILTVNRKYVVIPIIFLACFIAPAQQIAVWVFNVNLLRIMMAVGWIRVFLRKESDAFVWKAIDKVIVAWTVSEGTVYILLRGVSGDAIVNRLGASYDVIGMYFLFRCLVRDMDDFRQLIIALACFSLPVAFFFFLEHRTGRNIFSVFGGISEITPVRQGKIRAQGAYPHSIIAGSFWVTQLPFFLALWWQEQGTKKWLTAISSLSVLFIIYACASSTPVSGLVAVAIGFACYMFRQQMSFIRWGLLATIAVLHLIMKGSVWSLIARIDLVGGSTGYHRSVLIDQTIHHFSEWWLLGTRSTAHWGWGLVDTCNMYVNEAVTGGFFALILFFLVIALAFKGISTLFSSLEEKSPDYIFSWALGVSLFTHCVLFLGVSYFGQIGVIWYLLLATIGSLTVSQPIYNDYK